MNSRTSGGQSSSQGGKGIKPRDIALGLVTVVLLAGVYFGGTAVWQNFRGPSQAGEADCKTAQKLIDGAQNLPTGKKKELEAQYAEARKVWATIGDGYLQAGVSGYLVTAYETAGGDTGRGLVAADVLQDEKGWQDMADDINGHCKSHKVTVPRIDQSAIQ